MFVNQACNDIVKPPIPSIYKYYDMLWHSRGQYTVIWTVPIHTRTTKIKHDKNLNSTFQVTIHAHSFTC